MPDLLAGWEGSGVGSLGRTAVRLLLKLWKKVVVGKARLDDGAQGPPGWQDGWAMLAAHGAETAISIEMRWRVSPAAVAVVSNLEFRNQPPGHLQSARCGGLCLLTWGLTYPSQSLHLPHHH